MALLDDLLSDVRERQATSQLQREGSVMAGTSGSQQGLFEFLIKQLVGDSPYGFLGGGTLGPIRTKAQKKIAKTLYSAVPELLKEAIADPRMLFFQQPAPLKKAVKETIKELPPYTRNMIDLEQEVARELRRKFPEYSNYGIFRPALNPAFGGSMTINPNLLRGLGPRGSRSEVLLPEVATHELTHFLTEPTTRGISDKLGIEAAKRFLPHLSPGGRAQVEDAIFLGEGERAFSEALSYLSEGLVKKEGLSKEATELFKQFR